mgnify:FL=1
MSQTTKRALEASLKKLLLEKPLNKITINDITEDCGVNRMTFYYHFKDIYDLVEWSCAEDAKKALEGKKTYDTWQQGFLQIFEAVQENKPFIINVYRSVSREQVELYLYKLTYDLLIGVVNECSKDLNVREDAMELYGFATQEELNLFQQLISVSGVGPKAALSILSASTPANLALSIITGDEKALTCAQGIGKKIAQRVILELKDKLAKGQTISAKGEVYGGSGVTVIPENKLSEASAALAVLGYSQGEINVALKGIDLDSLTLEPVYYTHLTLPTT